METPSDPDAGSDDINVHLLIYGPLKCTLQLQSKLKVDEWGFLHVAGNSHADARAYYLYAALDEVARASLAMSRLPQEVLQLGAQPDPLPPKPDHLARLVYESIRDEVMLWTRKCVEVVVDLVLFTTTNDQEMFRLYICAKQLEMRLRSDQSRATYYLGAGGDGGQFVGLIRAQLQETENRVDRSRAWFLRPNVNLQTCPRPTFFQSFSQNFEQAMTVADALTKFVLTPSYHSAYSLPSRAVHGGIDPLPPGPVSIEDLRGLVRRVGMLGLCAATLAFRLAGVTPDGDAEQMLSALGRSNAPQLLRERLQPDFDVHDVVLVDHQYVAYIENTDTSAHGNTVYGLKRTNPPGSPSLRVEGYRLQLVCPAAEMRAALDRALTQLNSPEDERSRILSLPPEQLVVRLAESASKLYEMVQDEDREHEA